MLPLSLSCLELERFQFSMFWSFHYQNLPHFIKQTTLFFFCLCFHQRWTEALSPDILEIALSIWWKGSCHLLKQPGCTLRAQGCQRGSWVTTATVPWPPPEHQESQKWSGAGLSVHLAHREGTATGCVVGQWGGTGACLCLCSFLIPSSPLQLPACPVFTHPPSQVLSLSDMYSLLYIQ